MRWHVGTQTLHVGGCAQAGFGLPHTCWALGTCKQPRSACVCKRIKVGSAHIYGDRRASTWGGHRCKHVVATTFFYLPGRLRPVRHWAPEDLQLNK